MIRTHLLAIGNGVPSPGDFAKVIVIGLIALLVIAPVATLLYLAADRFWQWRDRIWAEKHPGQLRTGPADAPVVPYEASRAPSYMRGIDADGEPLPEPPRRRKLREL